MTLIKATFTPGPWHVSNYGIDAHSGLVLEVCQGTVYSEYSADGAYLDCEPRNAALIDAAPDLFWALADLLEFLGHSVIDRDGLPIPPDVYDRACAALIKAATVPK